MFVPASADLVSCLTLQMPLRHFITPVWHVSVICMCFSICNCPLEVWHMVAMDWYKHTNKCGFCNSSNKHELLQPHGPMETNLYIPYLVTLVLPIQMFLQCGNSPRAAPIFLAVLAAGGGCRRCAAGLPNR